MLGYIEISETDEQTRGLIHSPREAVGVRPDVARGRDTARGEGHHVVGCGAEVRSIGGSVRDDNSIGSASSQNPCHVLRARPDQHTMMEHSKAEETYGVKTPEEISKTVVGDRQHDHEGKKKPDPAAHREQWGRWSNERKERKERT